MRVIRLKKTLPLECVCEHCGKPYRDEVTAEVSRRFLAEGETPPPRGMMGSPDPAELPAKNEEEARRLAAIDLRQSCELLRRSVNERCELQGLRPKGEALCPHCRRGPAWLWRKNCGITGAVAGGAVGLLLTAALCVWWLKRPDIIIAIGLCGCLAYAGNRLFYRLESRRIAKVVAKLPKEYLPKLPSLPEEEKAP